MAQFYPLTVKKITGLTPNAVAITFDIPREHRDHFVFVPGQYVTIKKEINGQELRRAYSICSGPNSDEFTIGVKKVVNGSFSVYANDSLKQGDVLEVMPPEGRFTFAGTGKANNIAAFAAGSGITPILGIAQAVLADAPDSIFVLVYGNQSREETMFYGDIQRLQQEHPNRFFVYFINSRTQEDNALFGRIDSSTVNYALKNKHKGTDFDSFYLCGPEGMIQLVKDTLQNQGVDETNIHFELFTAPEDNGTASISADGKTEVTVIVDDEEFHFTMDQKAMVLDAVLNEDIDAPYSCQGGVCSSCIARIKEGKAEMAKNQILTDSEIAEGLILTCQAHPLSPTITIDYDDV
ncbi:MAG: 2Fe-2S iron-sulfur cluster-binding protein [Flavobacteriaceae bacterium]